MSQHKKQKKNTVSIFPAKKAKDEKVAMLTAYDAFTAHLLESAEIDAILVGDSVGNVIHGHPSTLPVTMDMMVLHTAAVTRGVERALVIADMPFMSYQPSVEAAVRNAGRLVQEGGAQAVKMEGGLEMASTIKRVIECGIPVMGHLGMTPQSINRFGGPKIQGREERSRIYLKESALALEEVGCFGMVLELMETDIARDITESVKSIPTIGIGAGPHCDGQVLVINDILGLAESGFRPKFLRQYADLPPIITDAVQRFIDDVKNARYPSDEESY